MNKPTAACWQMVRLCWVRLVQAFAVRHVNCTCMEKIMGCCLC